MIKKFANAMQREEKGFTLIELLIVIVIIAILIAVAIPSFLGARTRGQDSAAKSLLRNGQTQMEVFYTDNQTYVGADATALNAVEPNIVWMNTDVAAAAKDNKVAVYGQTATQYTLRSDSASGVIFRLERTATAGISKTTANPVGTW